jgi:cytochrome c oxidase cbb3-type subunit 3
MCAKKVTKVPGQVETTGHEWDGIAEFNNPLPRWWVWIFYATIVWGIWYSIAYPAWPLIERATQGYLGQDPRQDVAAEIQRFDEANAEIKAKLVAADLNAISADPALVEYAQRAGAAVFKTNCAQCHGAGAAGVQSLGYPNLLDDDWLWGGTMEDIHLTVLHGIRNTTDADARYSEMPKFGALRGPRTDLSPPGQWLVPEPEMGHHGGDAGDLLRHALDSLGSRPEPARSGGAGRSGQPALFLFLDRDLAA